MKKMITVLIMIQMILSMNKKTCIQGGNLTLVIIDQNTPNFAMFIVLKCLYNIIFLKSTYLVSISS